MGLAVEKLGQGPPVILLHGGLTGPEMAWAAQQELAERWELWIVHRAGYGDSAQISSGEDFELDARLLTQEVPEAAHLVGHSSGALAALYLTAAVPERVRSLTLIEPPAYHLAAEAAELRARYAAHFAEQPDDWVAWLREFFAIARSPAPSDRILSSLEGNAKVWKAFRTLPWEAELPLEAVTASPARKLVVSGGYLDPFEAVCDALAVAVRCRARGDRGRRARGPAHGSPVQRTTRGNSAGLAYARPVERLVDEPVGLARCARGARGGSTSGRSRRAPRGPGRAARAGRRP